MGAKVGEFRKLPGSKGRRITREWNRLMAKTLPLSPVVPDYLDGVCLVDVDGNEYLQFNSGISVANYGYGRKLDPAIEAIKDVYETSGMLMMNGGYYANSYMLQAAKELLDITPIRGGRGRFFGCTAGVVGVESAMKAVAMKRDRENPVVRPEEQVFIHMAGAFHGRTHAASSIIDQKKRERIHGLGLPYQICEVTFPLQGDSEACAQFKEDIGAALEKFGPGLILGVILEVVQGEGGVNPIDKEALLFLERVCLNFGIALIADEVQTGFCRCGGEPWAYTLYGIESDIVIFGKGAGYGVLPVCGMIVSEAFDFQEYGEHAATFGNDPILGAVLNESIKQMRSNKLGERSREMGEYLLGQLREAIGGQPWIRDIRGLGLFVGIEFCDPHSGDPDPEFSKKVWKTCENYGLLTLPAGLAVNRLAPPLCVSREEIDSAVSILKTACQVAAGC